MIPPLRPDPDLVRAQGRAIRKEYEAAMGEIARLALVETPLAASERYQAVVLGLARLDRAARVAGLRLQLDVNAAVTELNRAERASEEPDMQRVIPLIHEQEPSL